MGAYRYNWLLNLLISNLTRRAFLSPPLELEVLWPQPRPPGSLPRVKHPHWDPLKRSQTRPPRWTAPRRCWEYWPTTCGSAAGTDGMRIPGLDWSREDGYFCLLIMKNKDNLIWWLNHTYPTRMMLYRIMMILTMKNGNFTNSDMMEIQWGRWLKSGRG